MRLVFDDQAIADLSLDRPGKSCGGKTRDRAPIQQHRIAASFPLMGHIGRAPETFEWVVPRLPYIVVYEVDRAGQRVIVTAVLHGAQDREDGQS
jgi:toxin ParE1/3/4